MKAVIYLCEEAMEMVNKYRTRPPEPGEDILLKDCMRTVRAVRKGCVAWHGVLIVSRRKLIVMPGDGSGSVRYHLAIPRLATSSKTRPLGFQKTPPRRGSHSARECQGQELAVGAAEGQREGRVAGFWGAWWSPARQRSPHYPARCPGCMVNCVVINELQPPEHGEDARLARLGSVRAASG